MTVEDRAKLSMLSVDHALEHVLRTAAPLPPEYVPLDLAAGRFLAEEVRASADMPPFDRSAMDGYALRSADARSAPVELDVIEEIPAGHNPARTVGEGQASRIMTGAAIPAGADCVVMVEATLGLDGGRRVRILEPAEKGRHVRRAGEDLKYGSRLLAPGAHLGAPEIALLAAEGRSRVRVGSVPSVAVVPTGNELVGIDDMPRGSQIRETNSWSLLVLLRRLGIAPRRAGVVRDEPAQIAAAIADGLRSDVLILTGGVSMGDYDFVGSELKKAGCRALFERVAIQPGKPMFFGVVNGEERPAGEVLEGSQPRRSDDVSRPAPSAEAGLSDRNLAAGDGAPLRRRLVFGLPGNPVSSVVDFLVFARPALLKMMGSASPVHPMPAVLLAEPIKRRPGRRAYIPVRVTVGEHGDFLALPLPSMGSADLVALSRANALGIVHESEGSLPKGAPIRVLLLDDSALR